MNIFVAFVLGLLAGWAVEWIIDWFYWRRRPSETTRQDEQLRGRLKAAEERNAELEDELVNLRGKLSHPEAELIGAEANLQPDVGEPVVQFRVEQVGGTEVITEETPAVEPTPLQPAPVVHDDLIVIRGIGPVIAAKLNQAGIYSFADLAALTPEQLRDCVGDAIGRLADEESIIAQAGQLAADKERGG